MALANIVPGTSLSSCWEIGKLIGEGACARVFEVKRTKGIADDFPLVAKICSIPETKGVAAKKRKKTIEETNYDALYHEFICYQGHLRSHPNVPKLPVGAFKDDITAGVRYLIMQRLGFDTEKAFSLSGGWNINEIALYGKQMLSALQKLHENCCMVFVDVKPDNFAFGLPGTADSEHIYMLDFGLSDRYKAPGGAHKPQRQSAGPPAGTPEYLSLRCHAGGSPGRIDDIEALGYILIRWLKKGELPWSHARSDAECLQLKMQTNVQMLCTDFPSIASWIEIARCTAYEAEPDYEVFYQCLSALSECKSSTKVPVISKKISQESKISEHIDRRENKTSASMNVESTEKTDSKMVIKVMKEQFHPKQDHQNYSDAKNDDRYVYSENIKPGTGVGTESEKFGDKKTGLFENFNDRGNKKNLFEIDYEKFENSCHLNENFMPNSRKETELEQLGARFSLNSEEYLCGAKRDLPKSIVDMIEASTHRLVQDAQKK